MVGLKPRLMVVVIASLASCGSPDGDLSQVTRRGESAGGSRTAPESLECPYPRVAVEYLPWLRQGGSVPPPREAASGDSQLIWLPAKEATTWDEAAVTLRIETAPPPGLTDEPVNLDYPGPRSFTSAAGYLEEGEGAKDENVGDVAIWWFGRGEFCNFAVLSLFAPNISLQAGKTEIIRVAESMRVM
jgi:hypothetical protein